MTGTVDGQVCLVRFQMDTLRLFSHQQTDNKYPFAQANSKRINENRLGFRFPFETAAYICIDVYVYIYICKSTCICIYICMCISVNMCMYISICIYGKRKFVFLGR